MAYRSKYHEVHSDSDADADDEYERSVMSPTLPVNYHDDDDDDDDDESSHTDSPPHSTEHTPTTFTHARDTKGSPTGLITEWSEQQVGDFIQDLGLAQYARAFVENGIDGEALILLQHADLKEIGLSSVGHRLTILKAVYEIKVKQNIPIEPDHYVPLSADTSAQDAPPTQDDFAKVIRVVQVRDERIQVAESELRHLKDELTRVVEENRRLREEFLPLVRMIKDSQQPLPTPHEHVTSPPVEQARTGGGLSRKFSTKKLFLNSAPKNPSPTMRQDRTLLDSSSLDPSAAALAASSHLTASIPGGPQMSPNAQPQPSPTSPAYSQNNNRYTGRGTHNHENTPNLYQTNTWDSADTVVSRDSRTPGPLSGRPMRNNTNDDRDREPPLSGNTLNMSNPPSSAPPTQTTSSTGNPQVEIFKSFRVSIDDPCHKVLPVALKKYNITADWRQYALYIVHGDQERCLGLNERPLILFKQLDKEGRKPMFMLRKHAAPTEGHVNTIGGNDVRSTGSGNAGFGWDGQRRVDLPGGVL